ncbi:hypothetical protein BCV69DRAFT_128387 [Microstroma glucosiphilum]|uniref:Uncharacterized protein n=1 Tax=Pseudomicrostroma glucosiphilum TaxID=1684307 RepID=A0A316TY75_9BASI|nr:hypothetical protein BCV69DRAFT_128387 [Pseudomicrostroma glucosiphilum]PWN17738.1 hypothetical protein BCV69DRAFT_128387 [Pseudomicrostroma glucosiphilum]
MSLLVWLRSGDTALLRNETEAVPRRSSDELGACNVWRSEHWIEGHLKIDLRFGQGNLRPRQSHALHLGTRRRARFFRGDGADAHYEESDCQEKCGIGIRQTWQTTLCLADSLRGGKKSKGYKLAMLAINFEIVHGHFLSNSEWLLQAVNSTCERQPSSLRHDRNCSGLGTLHL